MRKTVGMILFILPGLGMFGLCFLQWGWRGFLSALFFSFIIAVVMTGGWYLFRTGGTRAKA